MNPTDFHSTESGRVIRAPQGYFAFVPAPLPPKIAYDETLVMHLSLADAALSELAGIGAMLPNPSLLIGPYIRREAVLSSKIEGTRTGFSDLLESEIAQTPETGDLLEVQNYVRALEYGIARLSGLPLSLRLVREIHGQLMEGVRGMNNSRRFTLSLTATGAWDAC